MAVLNIRNLPEEVHQRLRVRAARNGRSMEAEARTILAETIMTEDRAADAIQRVRHVMDTLYGDRKPEQVVDGFLADRRREAKEE